MQALIFDEPAGDTAATRVGELEIPEPGADEVTIRVTHAGVNFKDVMARRGDPGYVKAWPFVPGLEAAGFVHMLGADVNHLRAGQPVAAFTGEGGLAEFAVADARLTVPIPDGLAFELAAAAPGALLTAALLINDFGRLRGGEAVLVHSAAGGVGHAAAQFARLAGVASLLGTVGDVGRKQAAERAGYDHVAVRGPDLAAAILAATHGRGADVILDPQGTAMLDVDLQVAAPGARIVLFGNATGAPLGPLAALDRLMGGNISLTGFSLAALAANDPARVAATLELTLDRLASVALTLRVTVLDGLAAAADAQQALAEGRGTAKYVAQVAS
jgi:NADPH2:quinone reductase